MGGGWYPSSKLVSSGKHSNYHYCYKVNSHPGTEDATRKSWSKLYEMEKDYGLSIMEVLSTVVAAKAEYSPAKALGIEKAGWHFLAHFHLLVGLCHSSNGLRYHSVNGCQLTTPAMITRRSTSCQDNGAEINLIYRYSVTHHTTNSFNPTIPLPSS